jgi:hypothetical protein
MKVPESCSHIPGAGEGSHKVFLVNETEEPAEEMFILYM